MEKKQFAVITADVIESKKGVAENPNENIKSILDKKLDTINMRIKDLGIKTITPFKSSRGDEIQLVCKEFKNIPVLLRYLRYYCLPLKLRIGIGIGNIDYFYSAFMDNDIANEVAMTYDDRKCILSDYNEIESMLENNYDKINSWDMNGTAFYYARKALDITKSSSNLTNTCIYMDDTNWMIGIQTILNLIDLIMSEWSESKWRSVQMYDEHKTYKKAARILDLTKQAVQGNCERAKWFAIKEAESNLSKIFESLDAEYDNKSNNLIVVNGI